MTMLNILLQAGVAEDHGTRQPTVSNVVWEVAQKIYARANRWICFPSSNNQLQDAMRDWQKANRFPFAIGAIDCTHINLWKPTLYGNEYINRKGNASFNVQAIVDAKAKFLAVDCSWPGSVHDARIWRNSPIKTFLEGRNECGALLIGDMGYGISPCLMTPYKDANTPRKKRFNRILSRIANFKSIC